MRSLPGNRATAEIQLDDSGPVFARQLAVLTDKKQSAGERHRQYFRGPEKGTAGSWGRTSRSSGGSKAYEQRRLSTDRVRPHVRDRPKITNLRTVNTAWESTIKNGGTATYFELNPPLNAFSRAAAWFLMISRVAVSQSTTPLLRCDPFMLSNSYSRQVPPSSEENSMKPIRAIRFASKRAAADSRVRKSRLKSGIQPSTPISGVVSRSVAAHNTTNEDARDFPRGVRRAARRRWLLIFCVQPHPQKFSTSAMAGVDDGEPRSERLQVCGRI